MEIEIGALREKQEVRPQRIGLEVYDGVLYPPQILNCLIGVSSEDCRVLDLIGHVQDQRPGLHNGRQAEYQSEAQQAP